MYTDNKRGVVLISVLLIVLILSGISVSLGEIFFKSIKRSTYIEFQSTSIQLQRNMESLGIDLIDQNLRYNKGYLSKNDQLLKDEIFFESNGFLIRSRLVCCRRLDYVIKYIWCFVQRYTCGESNRNRIKQ